MIGVIVDGPGDFASLSRRFVNGFRIIKTDGPRGDSVSVSQIVIGSRKQIGILEAFGCSKVVLMIDFEHRPTSYQSFCDELTDALRAMQRTIPLECAVPNRMIENWYLADIEHLSKSRKYLRNNIRQKNFEGLDGKDKLKQYFKPGLSYNEVKHGADLFALVRFPQARSNSLSLHSFLQVVNQN